MNVSRREEPFRYKFAEPIAGHFKLTKVKGMQVDSRIGRLRILDLSWRGAKIASEYDFQITRNEVELMLFFQLLKSEFSISGKLIYQVRGFNEYICGLNLYTDEALRRRITNELKDYVKLHTEDGVQPLRALKRIKSQLHKDRKTGAIGS